MAVNPTVAKHLTEARRELVKQRDALTRDIEELDRMLRGHPTEGVEAQRAIASGGTTGITVANNTISGYNAEPAPPMEDEIFRYLSSQDREFGTAEVVRALTARYPWQASSVRSLIGKMARDGRIVKTRRGVYRALSHSEHLVRDSAGDASAPSGQLGAEVTGESFSDSPRMEGGTDDGSVPPEGRDDSALASQGDHGLSGDRTSVVGGSFAL